MSRRPRVDSPGIVHHVLNRGADRQDLFSCDDDHRYFQSLYADTRERFAVDVLAHCSMTNHFHGLLRSSTDGSARSSSTATSS